MCWLIRRKPRLRAPGQTSKQNTKKIFLRRLSLSRFLAKCVGLLDVNPDYEPKAKRQNKIQKNISSPTCSADGKTSKSKIKIAMKKFLKNLSFGVNFKLHVPQLMYEIITTK